jgi:hypothetical protein
VNRQFSANLQRQLLLLAVAAGVFELSEQILHRAVISLQ